MNNNVTPFSLIQAGYQLLNSLGIAQQEQAQSNTGTPANTSPNNQLLNSIEVMTEQMINQLSYQGMIYQGINFQGMPLQEMPMSGMMPNYQQSSGYGNAVSLVEQTLNNYNSMQGFTPDQIQNFQDAINNGDMSSSDVGRALRHMIYNGQVSQDGSLQPLIQLSGMLFKDKDISLKSLTNPGFLNYLDGNTKNMLASSLAQAGLTDNNGNVDNNAMNYLQSIASNNGPQGSFAQLLFNNYQQTWQGKWDTPDGQAVQTLLQDVGVITSRDPNQIETQMKDASMRFQDNTADVPKNDQYQIQDGDTLSNLTQAFSTVFGVNQQNQSALEQAIATQLNLNPTTDGNTILQQAQGTSLNLGQLYQYINTTPGNNNGYTVIKVPANARDAGLVKHDGINYEVYAQNNQQFHLQGTADEYAIQEDPNTKVITINDKKTGQTILLHGTENIHFDSYGTSGTDWTPPSKLTARSTGTIEEQMKDASYGWQNTSGSQPKNDHYILQDGDSVDSIAQAYIAVFRLHDGVSEDTLKNDIASELGIQGSDYSALLSTNGKTVDLGTLWKNLSS